MTNDNQQEIKKLSDGDDEYTALNIKEFTKAKIAMKNKVAAFAYEYKFTPEGKTEEQTRTQKMFYVDINDEVKPTRLNAQTIKEFQKGFKQDDWKKLVGKEIVATFSNYQNNDFIIWKPNNTVD